MGRLKRSKFPSLGGGGHTFGGGAGAGVMTVLAGQWFGSSKTCCHNVTGLNLALLSNNSAIVHVILERMTGSTEPFLC